MKHPLFWGVVVPALVRRLLPAWFFESPIRLAARHPWLTTAIVGAILASGGFAIAALGIVPMRASAGHWPVTEWFLHFSMRRSVQTNATWIDAPPLDDPALVMRGAGHYDLGCRPCHGSVAGETPRIPRHMEPPPRPLAVHARDWRPRELFYIVKHGMKFTGMPAWPAQQRDDEVWAVVAFLRRLPILSAEEYRRLTRGETGEPFDLGTAVEPPPDIVTETCARCHGIHGHGRGIGAFPKLAGQRAEYLDRALRAYAAGRRHSGVMGPVAASLTAEDREGAVRYYAALSPPSPPAPSPGSDSGRAIAENGVPDQMIPACGECHSAAPKNPAYPHLAGQYPEYLRQQLRLLQERRRGGSEYVHLMHTFVNRLTDEHAEAVADYFGSTAGSHTRHRSGP